MKELTNRPQAGYPPKVNFPKVMYTWRKPTTDPVEAVDERLRIRKQWLEAVKRNDPTNGRRQLEVEDEVFFLTNLLAMLKEAK
jgi:hypothetical protein